MSFSDGFCISLFIFAGILGAICLCVGWAEDRAMQKYGQCDDHTKDFNCYLCGTPKVRKCAKK